MCSALTQHFLDLAAPGIRQIKPYQPGKPPSELARELGITTAIKLASNENPIAPSPKVLQAIQAELSNINRYPDGNGFDLKQTLAKKYHINSNMITLGNGSNDILELLAHTFLTTNHAAVFDQNGFIVYPLVTQAINATAQVSQSLPTNHAMPYGHDLAHMLTLITDQTRLVFIANPNNPTGTWVNADELKQFLNQCPEHVIVVVDEAYSEYVTTKDYPKTISYLNHYPNLVITRTFSKAYGLAGLRIGYAFSHPAIADLLNRIRQPFNTNSLALAAASAALDDEQHLQQSIQTNHAGKTYLSTALTNMGLTFLPSQTNFLCVNVGREANNVYQQLLKLGVIVRPVGTNLANYLRISIGTETENQRAITALQKVLK